MDFLEVFENPSMMHAAVVHTPIVLATLGFPLLCLSALLPKNNTLRWITVLVYGLFAVSSFAAVQSGEAAYAEVPSSFPQEVWEQIDTHEALGAAVKYPAFLTFALVALSLLPLPRFRNVMIFAALASALFGAVLVTITAHYGGVLVYRYGVGYLDEEALSGAAAPPAPEPELVPIRPIDMGEAVRVSYTRDIVPIFEEHCIECHEGSKPDGDYDMTTVANMMLAGNKAGPGIIPGEPDKSSIVQYIRGELQPRMPRRKPALDPELLHTIRLWIAAGAMDDSTSAAPIEESDAAPADPFAAPAEADPFAAPEEDPAPAAADPFAAPEEDPAPAADPFATPEETPPAEADPFAAPEETPPAEADPFAAPEESPPAEADPFTAPEETPPAEADPFAAPEDNGDDGNEDASEDSIIDPFA